MIFVLGWIAQHLCDSWSKISKFQWELHWGWFLTAGVFYLIAFIPAAFFWYLSLQWLGQHPPLYGAIRAFYTSQLGKYVPGKAMVVVIRTGMIADEKVKVGIAAICVFYETLTMMATGALLSSVILLIWFREHWYYSLFALGAMLIAGLPIIPSVFVKIVRLLGMEKRNPLLADHLRKITWRATVAGLSLMTLLWVFFGIGLWATILGIGLDPGNFLDNLPRFVSATAIAIVLGFAIPISPGGIGIRETILAFLLIPYFTRILTLPGNERFDLRPEDIALIVSLAQRIISIFAELSIVACFAVVYWRQRLRKEIYM